MAIIHCIAVNAMSDSELNASPMYLNSSNVHACNSYGKGKIAVMILHWRHSVCVCVCEGERERETPDNVCDV